MLEALDTLGRASVALVWLPLLVWTGLWIVSEGASRLPARLHPLPRYRATQALIFALPLGLALAPILDPARLVPWLNQPVVVYATQLVGPGSIPVEAEALSSPVSSEPTWTGSVVLGLVLLVLASAATVGLIRLARGAWTLRRLRAALPEADPRLNEEAERVARSLRLSRRVEVVESDAVSVPMTFGVFRPIVVLPPGLSSGERRLALGHELVHVLRHDALVSWLEALVSAAFPWHPGVQRLVRRSDLLREMAADATLLESRHVRRAAYAELVTSFVTPPNPPTQLVAVGMADSASHVHQRLIAMTQRHVLRRSTAVLGWALAGLVLTGASLAVTASRAFAQEKRVELRTVEATTPPVVFLDGQRYEGDLSALNDLDIHSVDILQGEEAQRRFGVDHALAIITRSEAEARGLPAKPGTISAQFEGHTDGTKSRIQVDVREEGSEGSERRVVRRRVMDGAPTEDGEMVIELKGVPGNEFRYRSPEDVLDGLDVDPEEVETIDVRLENDQRTVTVRLKNGEVHVLTGPDGERGAYRLRPADAEPNEFEEKTGAPSPFEVVRADPNPTSDELTLSFEVADASDVRLRVYDIEGRELLANAYRVGPGSQSIRVDVSSLPAGTYIYRLSTPGAETSTGRFTVAR